MPVICYTPKHFRPSSQALIDSANEIIAEYESMGYELTLRQLYYQMVARDIIPNNQRSYKNLGSIINDARLAGLIDWNRIQDLTRELREVSHWETPADIIEACAQSFRLDKWEDQEYRPEVWVEKDALRNVVERICTELDVPFFACRGYVSQSEMWAAAKRMKRWGRRGQQPIIFHLGDHDPSGIDMSRDIEDRLELFGADCTVERIALNMDQVEEYGPPPNPAKVTDARFTSYQNIHGDESWELDALDPETLAGLIRRSIDGVRDEDLYEARESEEAEHRRLLAKASARWESVVKRLNGLKD